MDETQLENSKRALAELFRLWDKRSSSYGRVRFGSAIMQENGAWKHLISYLLPLHKAEVGTFDATVDYGTVKIVSGTVEIDRAKAVIRSVVEQSILKMPNLPEIPLIASANPDAMRRCNSSDRMLPVLYPFDEITFNPHQDRALTTSRMLYSPELPLFPSIKAAVEEYLDTQLGDSTCGGSFFGLAPDYRGRIWEVKLSTKGVQATIQCPFGSDANDLAAKVYFQKSGGPAQYGDPPIVNGVASFPADDFPLWFTLALLSRSTGDLVDKKSLQAGVRYLAEGIVVESTEQDLENLILGGESEVVEFKQQLPKGPELAREVVAFANSHGGRILVGVTDDSEVIGFEMGSINDHVENLLRSFCEPPISVSIENVSVRSKNIVVISVPEGTDKPYNAKDQGFYVRSSATTRRVTRYELDQMRKRGLFR